MEDTQMKGFYSKLKDLEKLEQFYNSIQTRNHNHLPYNEILVELKEGLGFIPTLILKGFSKNDSQNLFFWRVRTLDSVEQFQQDDSRISTFSYPEKQFCKDYGRANIPQCPILYCASDAFTACKETKCQLEESVYITEWKIDNMGDINFVSFLHDNLYTLAPLNSLYSYFVSATQKAIQHHTPKWKDKEKNIIKMFEIFNRIFTEDNQNYLYSSCLGHYTLYELRNDVLIYPSIAANRSSFNLAVHPEIIEKNLLRMNSIKLVKLKSYKDGHVLGTEIIKSGNIEDNRIIWK